MADEITYKITLWTEHISGAGTDATMYGQLIGENGKSAEVVFDNAGNDFEYGTWGTYSITTTDIGEPTQLRLFHDNGGYRPGWCLGLGHVQHYAPVEGSRYPKLTQWNLVIDTTVEADDLTDAFGERTKTVPGVWLASDSGGIDKTFNLKRSSKR
ncbi:PLAT/LH2 domain-containing protein [Streptomyces sp. NPDC004732]|uniref:PLAT/LH2 domain-containing protein n=1 Tax=Streptomyces sp. NPDC004732 TaxID=3154290 RepID=UPI0033AF87F7